MTEQLKRNWVLAIDPGAVHVGWSKWIDNKDRMGLIFAGETDNFRAPHSVRAWCKALTDQYGYGVMVIEAFRLYPGKTLGSQVHARMSTSELIGALKLIAKEQSVPWVEQGAAIQKPTKAQLKARGIKLLQRGPHAQSAQLHMWHYLLVNNLVKGVF